MGEGGREADRHTETETQKQRDLERDRKSEREREGGGGGRRVGAGRGGECVQRNMNGSKHILLSISTMLNVTCLCIHRAKTQ